MLWGVGRNEAQNLRAPGHQAAFQNESPDRTGKTPHGEWEAVNESAILQRLDSLTAAFVAMSRLVGARLSRADMCERLQISSNTLTARVRKGDVPNPGKDGKWLLSEVVEWESRQTAGNV